MTCSRRHRGHPSAGTSHHVGAPRGADAYLALLPTRCDPRGPVTEVHGGQWHAACLAHRCPTTTDSSYPRASCKDWSVGEAMSSCAGPQGSPLHVCSGSSLAFQGKPAIPLGTQKLDSQVHRTRGLAPFPPPWPPGFPSLGPRSPSDRQGGHSWATRQVTRAGLEGSP